ncbi:hypothetical protein ACJX0J_012799, partial [Zea mays]
VMDSGKASLMDNGFKDPKKHRFIYDLMKEQNLNFIAISETGRSDFMPSVIYGLKLAKVKKLHHITNYYKSLFGPPEENSITMDEARIDDIPQVTQQENEFLVIKEDLMALFTEFYNGSVPLYSLNFGTIILIPKPICLLNWRRIENIMEGVIVLHETIHEEIHYHQFCLILPKLANQISGATDSETQYWKTLSSWKGKYLSFGGRLVLINSI